MPNQQIEIFYCYAHEDEDLRNQLNDHLSLLKRQKLISGWYDRDISAGGQWSEEVQSHLQSARIILLLVSRSFLASDYCYEVEMQETLRRHEAGEAVVLPIILRSCYWESAPFGQLQALPKDGKAVTLWTDRDAAFTDVVKGIVKTIQDLDSQKKPSPTRSNGKRKRRTGEVLEGYAPTPEIPDVPRTPTAFNNSLKKAIERYYKELKEYEGKADYELALRSAFQNLLAEACRLVKWTLIPEQTLEGGIRPDGVARDDYFVRGFWEAKGPNSDLEQEIKAKIARRYPLKNIIFENTKLAVLYQNKQRDPYIYELDKPNDVRALLTKFLNHTEPDFATFEAAVEEFKGDIPTIANKLLEIIEVEYKQNRKFIIAFDSFMELCRTALDPKISIAVVKEMLVQHLLTERLFRTVFDNPDFVNRNVIAAEIEKVIQALISRTFRSSDFLKPLDRFHVAIERAAKDIDGWSERQHCLNTVYERFFQGFSVKQADTLGIVYTPQEIVDFMCASVEEVLQREFGTSIAEPGVQILDPATGTGSFIVNLLHRIPRNQLKHKYRHDLFCNEIALLPYYIASLNIEHEYFERIGEYEAFEGICFADTLALAEGKQATLELFVEENTERVTREKDAQIMVVIGNPPYNVGQMNENDNNKNRKYEIIDQRIKDTYVKDSKATNRNALSDMYVRFFRWATDRLQGRDGVVCFVSNNGFLDNYTFDGFRKKLADEFTQIYHVDLGGNVRRKGGGNVFGIMVGVGITILVRNRKDVPTDRPVAIYYHKVSDVQSDGAKLQYLVQKKNIGRIELQELMPDERYNWITEGMRAEFNTYIPLVTKEGKLVSETLAKTFFKTYTNGVETNRDNWVYDFDSNSLKERIMRFIDVYNGEIDRWKRAGEPADVDNFVLYDDTKIKWSRDLKNDLKRKRYAQFDQSKIRYALYRPFTKKYYFFDSILSQDIFQMPKFFPTPATESENVIIWLKVGSEWPMFALATNVISDYLPQGGSRCFPFYTYSEDGSNRRENITDWALKQFQEKYGPEVSKWNIFYYSYAMLHHPQYRELYKENLKRDLPRIPLLECEEAFEVCASIGKQLMNMHLNYEQAEEYPLTELDQGLLAYEQSRRVEKIKLSADKTAVIVNKSLTLEGVPQESFEYRVGNRSALEWVIDQYQVRTDKRSGIESDPNRLDDPEYIIRLIAKLSVIFA